MAIYTTIVIEHAENEMPIVKLGMSVLGCEVVAACVGDAVGEVFELEEKLEEIKQNQ